MSDIIEDLRAVSAEADKDFPGNADALPHVCTRAADEIERLREALTLFEYADNWFDTSDEAGGPYPAWRGPSPHDPEGIARRALEGGDEDE